MIIDHIRNRKNYYYLGENFKKALDICADATKADFKVEDIAIDGDNAFIRARTVATAPMEKCRIEAHRQYADVHFMLEGEEERGYADIDTLKKTEFDNDDTDFYEGEVDLVTVKEGYFMIVLPQDAHMPCVCTKEPSKANKLIGKIKVN